MPEQDPGDDHGARLKQLHDRIAAAKGTPDKPAHNEAHYAQANLAWRMVTELVAGIVIGVVMGLGLDTLFGTAPIFMVIFIGLGLAAGVKVMMRTAAEVNARTPAAGSKTSAGAPRQDDDETREG